MVSVSEQCLSVSCLFLINLQCIKHGQAPSALLRAEKLVYATRLATMSFESEAKPCLCCHSDRNVVERRNPFNHYDNALVKGIPPLRFAPVEMTKPAALLSRMMKLEKVMYHRI